MNLNIPLIGVWARGVFTCPCCNYTLPNPADLYKHIIGISNTNYGRMKIAECPNCFEKYYSHCSDSDMYLITIFIRDGDNIHIKNTSNE